MDCHAHSEMSLLDPRALPVRSCCLQTAHDPGYLVKHLLSGLPPVVERVKRMRGGTAPNSCDENHSKMMQSQAGASSGSHCSCV